MQNFKKYKKLQRPSRLLQAEVRKTASVMVVEGGISAHDMHSLFVLEGAINSEVYIGILERNILPIRRHHLSGST